MSSQQGKSGKELRIVTRHPITLDDIRRDEDKVRLLHIIRLYGEITEKALQYLVYELKQKGFNIGYEFSLIGGVPSSRPLRDSLIALLYTGLLETNPRNKKLRLTSTALEEFLPSEKIPEEEAEKLRELVEELRPKISAIDAEVELATMLGRGGRRRRRRF